MALSMLGLRVRAFDGHEEPLSPQDLRQTLQTFDALVDAPLDPATLPVIATDENAVVVVEQGAPVPADLHPKYLGPQRGVVIEDAETPDWRPISRLLGVDVPADPYPAGVPRAFGAFRDARPESRTSPERRSLGVDDTPWVLPVNSGWKPLLRTGNAPPPPGPQRLDAPLDQPTPALTALAETFPGNLAVFSRTNLRNHPDGLHIQVDVELEEGELAPTDPGRSLPPARSPMDGLRRASDLLRGRVSSLASSFTVRHPVKKSTSNSSALTPPGC